MSDEKGFLTDTDREFLRGEKEYSGENAKQMRYQRRRAIRDRTRGAFRDFSLLFETLDEKERNKIFDVGDDVEDLEALNEFRESLASTISFIYLSLEGEAGSDAIWRRSFRTPFEVILNKGVSKAEVERHPHDEMFSFSVTVDFEVNVVKPEINDVESAIDKIARHHEYELSEKELRAIVHGPSRGLMSGGLHELADRVSKRRKEIEEEEDAYLFNPSKDNAESESYDEE